MTNDNEISARLPAFPNEVSVELKQFSHLQWPYILLFLLRENLFLKFRKI